MYDSHGFYFSSKCKTIQEASVISRMRDATYMNVNYNYDLVNVFITKIVVPWQRTGIQLVILVPGGKCCPKTYLACGHVCKT